MSAHFNNKNTQKRTNFHGKFFFVVASVVCDRFTNLVSFGVNMNDITAFGFDMRLQCLFFLFEKWNVKLNIACTKAKYEFATKTCGNEAFCCEQFQKTYHY